MVDPKIMVVSILSRLVIDDWTFWCCPYFSKQPMAHQKYCDRAASRASLEVAQLLALQVDGSPRSHHPVSAKLEWPWWVYSVFGVDAVGIEETWENSSLPTSGGGLLISHFRWFGLFVFLQDFILLGCGDFVSFPSPDSLHHLTLPWAQRWLLMGAQPAPLRKSYGTKWNLWSPTTTYSNFSSPPWKLTLPKQASPLGNH